MRILEYSIAGLVELWIIYWAIYGYRLHQIFIAQKDTFQRLSDNIDEEIGLP